MKLPMCVKELNDKKEGTFVDSMYYKVIFVRFSGCIAKRPINDYVFCASAKLLNCAPPHPKHYKIYKNCTVFICRIICMKHTYS
jgi:hypothetical protein